MWEGIVIRGVKCVTFLISKQASRREQWLLQHLRAIVTPLNQTFFWDKNFWFRFFGTFGMECFFGWRKVQSCRRIMTTHVFHQDAGEGSKTTKKVQQDARQYVSVCYGDVFLCVASAHGIDWAAGPLAATFPHRMTRKLFSLSIYGNFYVKARNFL